MFHPSPAAAAAHGTCSCRRSAWGVLHARPRPWPISQYLPAPRNAETRCATCLVLGSSRNVVAFAVVSCSAVTIKPRLGDCSIPTGGKTDCGAEGTTNQTCAAAGCCWLPVNPNPNNEPWCFKKSGPSPPPGPAPPAPPIVSLGRDHSRWCHIHPSQSELQLADVAQPGSKNDTAARSFLLGRQTKISFLFSPLGVGGGLPNIDRVCSPPPPSALPPVPGAFQRR